MTLNSEKEVDIVNHPPHYNSHPSGIECIEFTRNMNFNLGNAFKYWWRRNDKDSYEENVAKCIWYIRDEIKRQSNPYVSFPILFNLMMDKLSRVMKHETVRTNTVYINLIEATQTYVPDLLERTIELIEEELRERYKTK